MYRGLLYLVYGMVMMLLITSCKHRYRQTRIWDYEMVDILLRDTAYQATLTAELNDGHIHKRGTEIKSESEAAAYTEEILTNLYKDSGVKDERPYEIREVSKYWFVNGSLPEEAHGGIFAIIFSAKDGTVIYETSGGK